MSKITYTDKVALNNNSDIADINKVNATDMNEIKEVVNENETKILLAVSSLAPATCATGDMYYNTTNNLIYTATSTNTWGTTGETPTSNTIYLVLTTNSAYAYDGEALISVGGQIANAYDNSQTSAYSTQYCNSAFGGTILWTNPNPTSEMAANTEINLSSDDYDMLEVIYIVSTTNDVYFKNSGRIPKGYDIKLEDGYIQTTNNNAVRIYSRLLTYTSATKLTAGGCRFANSFTSGTINNSFAVPMYIIGYKTGIFN